MTAPGHLPVLAAEVMAALAPLAGARCVDATFGGGGYTRAALAADTLHIVALDRDPRAIAGGAALAAAAGSRLSLVEGRFSQLDRILAERGIAAVDAIMFDIGVSSMQLDQAEYGMSFQLDGPLDMRMGQDGPTAADFLNGADEKTIADVIFQLGDEPAARRIARAIVADRPFTRTGELAGLVRRVVGGPPTARDKATRTFQALRIHINDELGELDAGLLAAERALAPGGRLAVVSFHSLEDRRVKAFLRARSGSEAGGSRHLPPAAAGQPPTFKPPAKAVRPSDAELAANPRARSATLRAAVRTSAPPWRMP